MEQLKKVGWVLLAGVISFVVFGILLIGLSFLVDYFKSQQMLEPRLFFDSFLKPIGLVFLGVWAWLSGRFLSKDKPKTWGRRAIYLYFAAAILPYVFSFFISPSS